MTTTRVSSLLCAAALCLALPARAGGLASSPYDEREFRVDHRGLYAAIGGGGILQLVPGGGDNANTFGFDVEGRLGYSFNSHFQLYLSGNYDSAAHNAGGANLTVNQVNVMVNLNNAFYADRSVTVYGRVGLGIGVTSGSTDVPGEVINSTKGLGELIGFGVDIHLTPQLSLAPEIFYRRTAESSDATATSLGRIDSVGLSVSLVYY